MIFLMTICYFSSETMCKNEKKYDLQKTEVTFRNYETRSSLKTRHVGIEVSYAFTFLQQRFMKRARGDVKVFCVHYIHYLSIPL